MGSSNTKTDPSADFHTIDTAVAEELQEAISSDEKILELVDGLKAIANKTRLKIVGFLRNRDLCVHDLSALMDMSQSAVSHQLKELRNEKIVERQKDGRVVYYSLNTDRLKTVQRILNIFLKEKSH